MTTSTSLDRTRLAARVDALRPEFARILKSLVEVPSVSAQGVHKPDIERCATVAAERARGAGGAAQVVATKGNPVVVGTIGDSAAHPTVVVYNHIDVQPAAEGKDGWTRAPFVFAEEGDRYYGRGSTADKGPGVTAPPPATLAGEAGIPRPGWFLPGPRHLPGS